LSKYTKKFGGSDVTGEQQQFGTLSSLVKELGTFSEDPLGTSGDALHKSSQFFSKSTDNLAAADLFLKRQRKGSLVKLFQEEALKAKEEQVISGVSLQK
jgi:hypothetical protein